MTEPSSNSEPQSNRREFLKGKAAAKALEAQITTPQPFTSRTQSDAKGDVRSTVGHELQKQAAYLEQYSKNAMACEFEILLNLHQYRQAGSAVAAAFQLIDDLEDQLTVYRAHSEISRINEFAATAPILVETELFGLLLQALKIYRQTNGAFDITAAALTKLWRFDRRSGSIPGDDEIQAVLKNVGSSAVQLDVQANTVKFERPGITLNLGGIGKGYAIDRVAKLLRESSLENFMIHGGQSSVLAIGKSTEVDEKDNHSGWLVGLSHPTLPSVRLAEITLRNQALGTSGTGRQGFFHRGQRYGHIIDPRSGWPASHFLSTTVIADSAALADALATAFFVMPIEEVEQWCTTHTNIGAILVVSRTGKTAIGESQDVVGDVSIQTLNLADEAIRFCP